MMWTEEFIKMSKSGSLSQKHYFYRNKKWNIHGLKVASPDQVVFLVDSPLPEIQRFPLVLHFAYLITNVNVCIHISRESW